MCDVLKFNCKFLPKLTVSCCYLCVVCCGLPSLIDAFIVVFFRLFRGCRCSLAQWCVALNGRQGYVFNEGGKITPNGCSLQPAEDERFKTQSPLEPDLRSCRGLYGCSDGANGWRLSAPVLGRPSAEHNASYKSRLLDVSVGLVRTGEITYRLVFASPILALEQISTTR